MFSRPEAVSRYWQYPKINKTIYKQLENWNRIPVDSERSECSPLAIALG